MTGVPDPLRGAAVKATVVLAPGFSGGEELTRELQTWVKRQDRALTSTRASSTYVDELPKTVNGKIRRVAIRQADSQDARGAGVRAPGGAGAREAGPAGGGQPQAVPADGVGGCGCGGGAGAAVAPPRGAAGGATAAHPLRAGPGHGGGGALRGGEDQPVAEPGFRRRAVRRPRDAGGFGRSEPPTSARATTPMRSRRAACAWFPPCSAGCRVEPGRAEPHGGRGAGHRGRVGGGRRGRGRRARAAGRRGRPWAGKRACRRPPRLPREPRMLRAPATRPPPRRRRRANSSSWTRAATTRVPRLSGASRPTWRPAPMRSCTWRTASRNLTQAPEAAAEAAGPIQEAARLAATAVVNNSHVMGENGLGTRARGVAVRRGGGVPSGAAAGLHHGAGSARPAGKRRRSLLCVWAPASIMCDDT